MKFRVLPILIACLLLVAGGIALFAWSKRPQIVELDPPAGAENVAATSSIRLIFSRPMDTTSINSRLVFNPDMPGTQVWHGNTLIFTPNQPWPNGKVINIQLAPGGRAASWLAFSLGSRNWSFSTRETALAYLWPANGPANIYALDPVTGAIQQYTRGINVLDFSASGDGSKFYFSASNSAGGTDLYQFDLIKADSLEGSPYQAEKLLDCQKEQCRNPVVSPDGNKLAYEYLQQTTSGGAGRVQVWILRLSDLESEPAGQPNHATALPAWSSSNLLVYYDFTSSGYEILNPINEERIMLGNLTGQPGNWSPNGEFYLAPEISYQQATQNHETAISHLYRYHIQDLSADDLSGKGGVEDVEALYSPDGGTIAFTRKFLDAEHWSLGRQIWIMGSDGSNSHAITDEVDYNHYDLTWSRDATRLAYVRFNQERISDPPELWMVNVDGSNPVQLVIGGYAPLWIP